ncbi:MAG: autotransporter-associated beta strand repeat-containing protein [Candidatus Pacebacteria bacterium]|nr:autotransporter-associated beta strand repeat-containing protein [Candidatus Paceibacterota bacterium]
MKKLLLTLSLVSFIFLFSPRLAFAATKYWSGTGTWNAANTNWGTSPGGPYNAATFNTGDDAVFEGSAGTVTVSAPNHPNSITFNKTGYTLNSGTLTLDGPSIAVSSGAATINSSIAGSAGLAKSGGGTLTLSGNNSFTGGLTVKSGTLEGTGSVNAFGGSGTGAITLGDSSGSANATLSGGAGPFANPISVASGNTGAATIIRNGVGGNSTFSGAVTLNSHNLVLNPGGNALSMSGGFTGAGNLAFNSSFNSITIQTGSVNNTGTITQSGAGAVTVSGGVGANVTDIIQNGTASLTISTTALTVNSGGTTLTNTSSNGSLLTVSGGVNGTGNLIIKNNTGTANAVTLSTNSVNNTGAVTNSGAGSGGATISAVVGVNVTGVVQNSASSSLTLSGANTYTGPTTVSAGTLQAGVASVANVSGAFGKNSTVTMANVAGAALNITGFNTQIGSLTGGGAAGGNVTLGSATLTVGGDNTSPAAYAGVLSGAGGLTKIGAGTLTLTGINTYAGATTIAAGTLNANSTSALGSGGAANTLIFSGGALQASGAITSPGTRTLTLTSTGLIDTNGQSVSIAGVMSGAGGLTKSGAGTLTLSAANTFTGKTSITGGALSVTNNGNLGATPGSVTPDSITLNGGTLQFTGGTTGQTATLATNRGITLGSLGGTLKITYTVASGSFNALTDTPSFVYSGIIAGTSGGNLAIQGGAGTNNGSNPYLFKFNGASTYNGNTTIDNATLTYFNSGSAGDNRLPASTVLTIINNGAFNICGQASGTRTQTLAGLIGDSTAKVGGTNQVNPAVLALNPSASSFTWSGVIGVTTVVDKTGINSLQSVVKSGAGTEIFAGQNTYAGATNVNAGVLRAGVASVANVSGAFGNNSAVTLANAASAVLDLADFNTQIGSLTGGGGTGGNVTLGSATLTVGGDNTSPAAYAGVLSGAGSLAKIGTGAFSISNTVTLGGDFTISAGTVSANSSMMNVAGNWSNSGTFSAGTSMVTLNGAGAQTMSGANTFYGLAITGGGRTVSFQSGAAQSIAANGSLALSGSAGHLLTLAPLTPASEWQLHLDAAAAQAVSYVSVSYSNAGGFAEVNAANGTNSDGGNTTNWNFGAIINHAARLKIWNASLRISGGSRLRITR